MSVRTDDGVELATWTDGTPTDLPPVVLLHGGPGLWDYLEPVAAMLAPLTVVHRYDQRGCGRSEGKGEYTFARYLEDLENLRRHWGYESWVVIGHSFGAMLAIEYARTHPDYTTAVGYLSGTGMGDWRTPYRQARANRMTSAQTDRLAALEALPHRSRAEEVEFRTLAWSTDFVDPDDARQAAQVDLPINFTANRMLATENRAWPDGVDLTPVTMPCWFIHGAADPRPAAAVEELAAHVPNAELHILAGAAHQPWIERPAELSALLQQLVRSAGRGRDQPAEPSRARSR